MPSSRLAAIEQDLARMQGLHDLAMSAFKFDEANELQRQICALEDERRALAQTLPACPPPPEPTGVIPVLVEPRHRWRRRKVTQSARSPA